MKMDSPCFGPPQTCSSPPSWITVSDSSLCTLVVHSDLAQDRLLSP